MMLYFLFALTVSRDAEVSVQDTVYESGFTLERVFLLSSGEYLGSVIGSGPLLVSGDSVVRFPEPMEAYHETFGVLATSQYYTDPDGLEHSVFKVYDINGDSRIPIRIVDVPSPSSDYTLIYQDVTVCGVYLCGMSVFIDYADGTAVVKVHRFNASSSQEILSQSVSGIVNAANLYGFRNLYSDTAFVILSMGDDKVMYGLDLNLPAASNPVITYTSTYRGGYFVFGEGGLFQNGSHIVFAGMFASSDTVALMGYDFTYSSVIDERLYVSNSYFVYSLYGNGICSAYGDGSALRFMSYDIFTGTLNESAMYYSGYVWDGASYGGDDACIFFTSEGLLALDPVTHSALDDEIISPVMSGLVNSYPYRDVPSFSTDVLVMMTPVFPMDTVVVLRYGFSGVFDLLSADTVLFYSIPTAVTVHGMQYRDGSLLAKANVSGFSNTIMKLGDDLGFLWMADTIALFQNAFLPSYIYVMTSGSEGLRKLNLNNGQPGPYFYSAPATDYGYPTVVREVSGDLFMITGGSYDTYIHILDTTDLSLQNLVTLSGVSLSWNVDISKDGNYVVFLSSNYSSNVGEIYVYDVTADNLIGPYQVDFDPSATEFPAGLYLDGDTLFAAFGTANDQRIYKCYVDLASCIDAPVDHTAYGNLYEIYVQPESVYVSTTGGYIYVMDRNLDNAHAVGPLPSVVQDMRRVGDYMAIVYGINGIVDTTIMEFRRISDLNVVDYADTMVAFRLASTELYEYASGQYYYYLALRGQFDPIGKIYRYNVTSSVGRDEEIAAVRYTISGGRLIIEGRGLMDARLFDVAGRQLTSYRGEVDGRMTLYRFNNPGIYILKINGRTHKLVNVGR